jgi:Transglutaminase-like superfamily
MSQNSAAKLYVAPQIRHVWIGDRVAILDLRSESYFALDPIASLMWREFTLGHDRDERRRNLTYQFPDDVTRLEPDLDIFENRCIESGWLVRAPCAPTQARQTFPTRGPAERFLTERAWLRLFRVTRSLSSRGFSWTYNAVLQKVDVYAIRSYNQEQTLLAAVTAFARAENFFNLKTAPADCLPRSLALFQFLRRIGLPAEHCIGVQQFPFSAHAWTEFRGHVVHDDPQNQERFTVIARIPT